MWNKTFKLNLFNFTVSALALCFCLSYADNFNNKLIDAQLSKSSIDGVNITLSTSEQYNDKVFVNKRNDNEYVILLPETSVSSDFKPKFEGLSESVTSVDVKTFPFQNNIKGYTKITIKTSKPLNINPKMQQYVAKTGTIQKDAASDASVYDKEAPRPNYILKQEKPNIEKLVKKHTQMLSLNKNDKTKALNNKAADKNNSAKKALSNNDKKNVTVSKNDKKDIAYQTKTIETSTKKIQPAAKIEKAKKSSDNSDLTATNKASEAITDEQKTESEAVKATSEKEASPNTLKAFGNHLIGIILLIAGAFALMLLAARNMAKTSRNTKKEFNTHLKETETPAAEDITVIEEDGITQEEIASDEVISESEDSPEPNIPSEIEGLFAENDEEQLDDNAYYPLQDPQDIQNFEDVSEDNIIPEQSFEQVQKQTYEEFNTEQYSDDVNEEVNLAEDFGSQDFGSQDFGSDMPLNEVITTEEENIDENVLNNEDDINLNETSQTEEMSNLDIIFSDNIDINTESEIAIQEDFNSNILNQEETVIDDEQFTEGLSDVTEEPETTSEEEISAFDETEIISETETVSETAAEEISEVSIEDSIEEPSEKSVEESAEQFENISEDKETDAKNEDDIVKSEFVIDENKAFYLVDYEDYTSLVGSINDNIFVLKQFDEITEAPLKARISEQGKNSARYMTRVGKFRGVVEVTSDNMKLLVEL